MGLLPRRFHVRWDPCTVPPMWTRTSRRSESGSGAPETCAETEPPTRVLPGSGRVKPRWGGVLRRLTLVPYGLLKAIAAPLPPDEIEPHEADTAALSLTRPPLVSSEGFLLRDAPVFARALWRKRATPLRRVHAHARPAGSRFNDLVCAHRPHSQRTTYNRSCANLRFRPILSTIAPHEPRGL